MRYTAAMIRLYSCASKRVYTTYAAANKAAKMTRKDTRKNIQPYYCRYCGLFHAGEPTLDRQRDARHKPHYEPTIESELQEMLQSP